MKGHQVYIVCPLCLSPKVTPNACPLSKGFPLLLLLGPVPTCAWLQKPMTGVYPPFRLRGVSRHTGLRPLHSLSFPVEL